MGISYLTKHLLPYAESVSLGTSNSDLPRQKSVVIDGPSLVYDIYYRLLTWMNPNCDILDVQPTCNEVSRAVVIFLCQLDNLGVEIKKICFDGALPVSKRHTRLSRIEKSRHRLELCRKQTFTLKNECRKEMSNEVIARQLWRERNLPVRWKNLPENVFMVSAVFEDLVFRWSLEVVKKEVLCDIDIPLPNIAGAGAEVQYLWADITVMIAGEADVECARVAKISESAILTSDSDLLVHDLGAAGSVIFLNSLQMIETTQQPDSGVQEKELRGQGVTPYDLSRRLGIPSLQPFGYELSKDPRAPFSKLLRLAKEYGENEKLSVEYCDFLREYEHGGGEPHAINDEDEEKKKLVTRGMDPRVSELFWQYESPDIFSEASQFHVYLGILHEDPSRRCAWEQARIYRSLGYALLNLSYPALYRSQSIYEFVRRGGRIVAEQVTLAGEKTVLSDLVSLQRRLDLAGRIFDSQRDSPADFWFLFALSEVYQELANTATVPTPKELENFLSKGFMGKGTDWRDIHILAQVQAVLYSLRILQQLIQVTASNYDIGSCRSVLVELPPLYRLIRSRSEIIRGFADKQVCRRVVHEMVKTYG